MNRPLVFLVGFAFLGPVAGRADETQEGRDHWAFQPLSKRHAPAVANEGPVRNGIDRFVLKQLERRKLTLSPAADRVTLLRRLSFDLTGLPPTPQELAEFKADSRPHAYRRAVERLLASPAYGERWGKMWLDACGYADSNGYFNADTNRPLAYKYRDYVIRSFNADKSFDQFVREQLAGDEIAGFGKDVPVTPRIAELLTATHFLRNSQDGSSESDGNPDEVTVDRATVLEGTLQITMNTLLGVTIQCARCHEHKFEPIAHAEYYQLQSIFYPAFPFLHRDKWIGPVQRVGDAASKKQLADWQTRERRLNDQITALHRAHASWVEKNRPPQAIVFRDDFAGDQVAEKWSNSAPGDTPGGAKPVNVDSDQAPAARIRNGRLQVIESGDGGNRWLSTKQKIDWTPQEKGEWTQVTFDLLADRVREGEPPAARIGFYIALHDFDDNGSVASGNVLLDGNPAGGAAVHLDYPGKDQRSAGVIGTSRYVAGRSYGVRITNIGGEQFRLTQLVDGIAEAKTVTLGAKDLPDGGFGFEFCCGRSFVVDNVLVESVSSIGGRHRATAVVDYAKALVKEKARIAKKLSSINAERRPKPGKLAWVTDLITPAPAVHRLERGAYADPAEKVEPGALAVLSDGPFRLPQLAPHVKSSGRRLALAQWLTRPGSRPSGLLSRVMVNRIWQQHFGRGLVATPDNFGQSGTAPSHPELLEFLAAQFVRSGWSIKAMHRLIVHSAVYRQASRSAAPVMATDPENRLWSRFPLRRLNAESIRDAMLAASGELDERQFGPYVPTQVLADGNVVVDASRSDARRRGIYLQQRRTRMNSLLALFDAPAMVATCGKRSTSTVPLQSLALLNSPFVRQRAEALAQRLLVDGESGKRVALAFQLVYGRAPLPAERLAVRQFMSSQRGVYGETPKAELRVLTDVAQMLFASNAFLYVE